MQCPCCGTLSDGAFCPNCGAPLAQASGQNTQTSGSYTQASGQYTQAPGQYAQGPAQFAQAPGQEPRAVAVMRQHLSSGLYLALICLSLATGLLSIVMALTMKQSFINFTVNGRYSPIGSVIFALLLTAAIALPLWKTYQSARHGAPARIATAALTLGKVVSVIALIGCVLAFLLLAGILVLAFIGDLDQFGAVTVNGQPLAQLISQGRGVFLAAMCILLLLVGFALAVSICLLRSFSAAKRVLLTGYSQKLSAFAAWGLLIGGALMVLGAVASLSNGIPNLLNNLLAAAQMICLGLLLLRCGKDLAMTP